MKIMLKGHRDGCIIRKSDDISSTEEGHGWQLGHVKYCGSKTLFGYQLEVEPRFNRYGVAVGTTVQTRRRP